MIENEVIKAMLNRKSVRKYKPEAPGDDVLETIVRAGMQAPFASQLYSIILNRSGRKPMDAPLHFVICADFHKLERFMKIRGWKVVTNDLTMLLLGIQDAAYAAQNMVIAAESLGLGSCFLGVLPGDAEGLAKEFALPRRVFPVVELVMGYPDEDYPPRPRYPMDFTLFVDSYPDLDDERVLAAMKVMDDGYLAQQYYQNAGVKLPLSDGRTDRFTFDDYSWTEHISRKWGQWFESAQAQVGDLRRLGFKIDVAD